MRRLVAPALSLISFVVLLGACSGSESNVVDPKPESIGYGENVTVRLATRNDSLRFGQSRSYSVHSLRVTVASAAFPKYDRNLNTGGDNERDTTFVSAHQQVLHDPAHASYVTLPIIPRGR